METNMMTKAAAGKHAKSYVPIFFDWLETTQDLSAEEKGHLIDAVLLYACGSDEWETLLETGCEKTAFRFMKGQIDRFNAISGARSAAGSRKKEREGSDDTRTDQRESDDTRTDQRESDDTRTVQTESDDNKTDQTETNDNKTDQNESNANYNNNNNNKNKNKNKNKNTGEKEKEKERRSFAPPTLEEVRAYCLERNNGIDPEYWMDYHVARNWVLSNGKKMSDWKAVIRTWEKNNFSRNRAREPVRTVSAQQYTQRSDEYYVAAEARAMQRLIEMNREAG